jgi:putative heme iron utilization protein
MMLELYQEVALTRDLPEHQRRVGDIGTLVDFVAHPSGGEDGCLVEFFNAVGESIVVVAVAISAVEALRADKILTVRALPQAS